MIGKSRGGCLCSHQKETDAVGSHDVSYAFTWYFERICVLGCFFGMRSTIIVLIWCFVAFQTSQHFLEIYSDAGELSTKVPLCENGLELAIEDTPEHKAI